MSVFGKLFSKKPKVEEKPPDPVVEVVPVVPEEIVVVKPRCDVLNGNPVEEQEETPVLQSGTVAAFVEEIEEVQVATLLSVAESTRVEFNELHTFYKASVAFLDMHLFDIGVLPTLDLDRLKTEFERSCFLFDGRVETNRSEISERLIPLYKDLSRLFRRSICEEYPLLYSVKSTNKIRINAINARIGTLLGELDR
jgi:hypothetical protein